MKLSVFTTTTDPIERGDLFWEAMGSYDFADEVVVVDGSRVPIANPGMHEVEDKSYVQVNSRWPQGFSWELIGQQFQRGYEAASGDWVIHADLDFIFHEQDYRSIRKACEENSKAPALSFYKWQFILPDRYNLKSRLVIAVNKGKYGDRIRFDSGGDLAQPSLDGKYIDPNDVPEAGIPIWNYEKLIKTQDQVAEDVGRMARAYEKHFGEFKLGGPDDDSALDEWLTMVLGRIRKPQKHIPLKDHPKVMRGTIRHLTPDMWGYGGWGLLEDNDYVRIECLR